MGDHLRVGVRQELHALRLQLFPQQAMVFDDAVLDHRHLPASVEVGMGVAVLRLAVGGPTGVANAALARGPLLLHPGREVEELALRPHTGEPPSPHGGHPGGVVAAVLQLA